MPCNVSILQIATPPLQAAEQQQQQQHQQQQHEQPLCSKRAINSCAPRSKRLKPPPAPKTSRLSHPEDEGGSRRREEVQKKRRGVENDEGVDVTEDRPANQTQRQLQSQPSQAKQQSFVVIIISNFMNIIIIISLCLNVADAQQKRLR